MNQQAIQNLLSPEALVVIDDIQLFDEIDSTNAESLRQIQAGKTGNRLILAVSQTAGRGRRGREWLSLSGAGIYLSFTRQFNLEPNALQGLSLLTAISLQSALSDLGISGLQLKWPNDVLHEKKKLAGILLELQDSGQAVYVVFGVGVNINLPEKARQEIGRPVTDIAALTDPVADINAIVATLMNTLCANLALYEKDGFAPFQQTWNQLDCYKGSDIVIESGENRSLGKSLGVDASGALLMQTASGQRRISGGEIFPSLREASD